jgi:hypothetical protein
MKADSIMSRCLWPALALGLVVSLGCAPAPKMAPTGTVIPQAFGTRPASAAGSASPAPNLPTHLRNQTIKLSGGRDIVVLDVGIITTKTDRALVFKYQTRVKISDVDGLRKEAEEAWEILRPKAEKTGFEGIVLSANEPPTQVVGSVVTSNEYYNFVFKKQPDGSWTLLK